VAAVQREKRPLKGAAKISLRVGKILNRFKMAKHFRLEITRLIRKCEKLTVKWFSDYKTSARVAIAINGTMRLEE
jgi:hypothetical protein